MWGPFFVVSVDSNAGSKQVFAFILYILQCNNQAHKDAGKNTLFWGHCEHKNIP